MFSSEHHALAPGLKTSQRTTFPSMEPQDKGAESACKKRRLSFTEIGLSAGFKVFIGPDKKEHLIHSAVLAKQSPVLDALVNSGMKETGENAVVWEHVSEHTFAKFSQFAYTGNISIKRSTEVYEYTEHSAGDGNSVTCGQWLIQHADLMVFAECYAVDELLTITSSTLDDALNLLIPLMKTLPKVCQGIATLFQYCAENRTPAILQEKVNTYLTYHGGTLWKDTNFRNIVMKTKNLSQAFIDCLTSDTCPKTVKARCPRCKEMGGWAFRHCGWKACELVYSTGGMVVHSK